MKLAVSLLLIHDDAIFRPSWNYEQKRYEILIFSTGWLNHLAIFFMLITLGLEQPQQRSRCFPDSRDPWNLHHRKHCRLSIDLLQAECLFVRKKRTYGLMFDTYSIYTCVLMMLLWCSICTIFINIWWYVSIYIYICTWYINIIYIMIYLSLVSFLCSCNKMMIIVVE